MNKPKTGNRKSLKKVKNICCKSALCAGNRQQKMRQHIAPAEIRSINYIEKEIFYPPGIIYKNCCKALQRGFLNVAFVICVSKKAQRQKRVCQGGFCIVWLLRLFIRSINRVLRIPAQKAVVRVISRQLSYFYLATRSISALCVFLGIIALSYALGIANESYKFKYVKPYAGGRIVLPKEAFHLQG